ncbi:WhiB family transcriptional regulator [Planomonospora sp. ID67723]|uniref:WhiB family transcriptional regulator n=1 Tax=Planomonospora sp. ID67723 TaxID=2738134 RepID=UPI0018C3B365|nr:WhiB family transcriptional regulator [Planomonospora sp. ID67723]MBG0828212.1 WhiB family transcriptional regulator [Planomonospora sp. ID67723]
MSHIFAPALRSVHAQPTSVLAAQVVKRGACVGAADPDAWFPPEPMPHGGEPTEAVKARRAEYEATARRLCGDCPVRAECLELALREEHDLPRTWFHGIRGGTAPWERQNIVYNRRRTVRRLAARQAAQSSEAVA